MLGLRTHEDLRRWAARVPAGLIVVGVIVGLTGDAFTCLPAAIPIAVGTLLLLCVAGGIVVVAKFRSS